jgi:FlaG/FlaF family flagellin (archaellin)
LPRKRSRKGISDIVANLLIMAMVVALFGMVILWASGYLGQSQGIWNVQSRRAQEAIVIETAKYASGVLTIYARNVGTSTVELNTLYIVDTSSNSVTTVPYGNGDLTFKSYNVTSDSESRTAVPKQLVKILVTGKNLAGVIQSGHSYRLDLVTTLGADAAFIYVAP